MMAAASKFQWRASVQIRALSGPHGPLRRARAIAILATQSSWTERENNVKKTSSLRIVNFVTNQSRMYE
jgi:hypothetical protein